MGVLRFHIFGDFQHFGDAVPVAGGALDFWGFGDEWPVQFGAAGAVGEVDVGFAAFDEEFFGVAFDGSSLFAGGFAGVGGEKCDQQLARVDVFALGEPVPCDDVAEILGASKNDVSLKSKFLVDGGFEIFAEFVEVTLVGCEDDVAALDVGLRIAEFEGCEEFLQIVHFDAVVAANVDAAEHADDDGHSGDDTAKFANARARSRRSLRLEVEIRRRGRTRLRGGDGHRGERYIGAYRLDFYVAQKDVTRTVEQNAEGNSGRVIRNIENDLVVLPVLGTFHRAILHVVEREHFGRRRSA